MQYYDVYKHPWIDFSELFQAFWIKGNEESLKSCTTPSLFLNYT